MKPDINALADHSWGSQRLMYVMLLLAGLLVLATGIGAAAPYDQGVAMACEHAGDVAQSHLVGPNC